jgi:hypothetical protein
VADCLAVEPRKPADNDPTREEPELERDGSSTEQRDDAHRSRVVVSSEGISRNPESTLDLLRALEGAEIVIEHPTPPTPEPAPEPSYNPYDSARPRKK